MIYLYYLTVIVGLPVSIVWIVFHAVINRDNKNAEIIIKAIENNPSMESEKLIDALRRGNKSAKQIIQIRLFRGCLFSLLGVVFGVFSAILAYHQPSLGLQYPSMLLAGIAFAIGFAYLIIWILNKNSNVKE